RHHGDRQPSRMEDEPGQQDELARHRADRSPREELLERADRSRMDEQLADVGGHLNEEDPTIVAPQPPADRLQQRDVERGRAIVLVERLVPAVVDAHALPAQDRPEEMHLQDMSADAPEIEIAVSPPL